MQTVRFMAVLAVVEQKLWLAQKMAIIFYRLKQCQRRMASPNLKAKRNKPQSSRFKSKKTTYIFMSFILNQNALMTVRIPEYMFGVYSMFMNINDC